MKYYADKGELPSVLVAFIEDTEISRLPEGCERICQRTCKPIGTTPEGGPTGATHLRFLYGWFFPADFVEYCIEYRPRVFGDGDEGSESDSWSKKRAKNGSDSDGDIDERNARNIDSDSDGDIDETESLPAMITQAVGLRWSQNNCWFLAAVQCLRLHLLPRTLHVFRRQPSEENTVVLGALRRVLTAMNRTGIFTTRRCRFVQSCLP